MPSKKQSLDVGKLLIGLRDHGSPSSKRMERALSASSSSPPPGASAEGAQALGPGSRAGAALRVGGIVVGHVTAAEYRAIQTHIACGGTVDIMLMFS